MGTQQGNQVRLGILKGIFVNFFIYRANYDVLNGLRYFDMAFFVKGLVLTSNCVATFH